MLKFTLSTISPTYTCPTESERKSATVKTRETHILNTKLKLKFKEAIENFGG
jgi:hypothetical protein